MKSLLIKPVVTEKSVGESEKRFYSFIVQPTANKLQIKAEVARIFKVQVESVRIVNVKSKTKRRGRYVGQTSETKKAIVKLAKDQKIEFFEKL